MGYIFKFLYENGDQLKTLGDKMLDEEKTREILQLQENDTIALGSGYEKQVYRVKKIDRTLVSADISGKDEDETYYELIVEVI